MIESRPFDFLTDEKMLQSSAVDSGGAGGARAPPEFGGLEKGRSLISAYRSLAITTNAPGFKKLSTVLQRQTKTVYAQLYYARAMHVTMGSNSC